MMRISLSHNLFYRNFEIFGKSKKLFYFFLNTSESESSFWSGMTIQSQFDNIIRYALSITTLQISEIKSELVTYFQKKAHQSPIKNFGFR
jgi:hypothetical protein